MKETGSWSTACRPCMTARRSLPPTGLGRPREEDADKNSCMIANTFIKRPVTAIVISIVLVLTGSICILSLPVDQYPDITPPIVQVNGQFTGADAQTVEQTMATPIEGQINGTPGMEYMQSNSTNNGLM